jgi:hypothetical protein
LPPSRKTHFSIPTFTQPPRLAVAFAVILNAVKDPEEFHSPELLELFQPVPLAGFVLKLSPREHETGPAKNKVQKSGMFLAVKIRAFSHHVYHAFHHDFTSKLPQKNTHFFKNPLKNARKTAKTAPGTANIFSANSKNPARLKLPGQRHHRSKIKTT